YRFALCWNCGSWGAAADLSALAAEKFAADGGGMGPERRDGLELARRAVDPGGRRRQQDGTRGRLDAEAAQMRMFEHVSDLSEAGEGNLRRPHAPAHGGER